MKHQIHQCRQNVPNNGAAVLTASFFMRMDWRQDVMSFAFVETALNILDEQI
jgi:hypothetical protein